MDYDISAEEPEELFNSMYGEITEEQWETYREQVQFGQYAVDDSDDDSNLSDRSASPCPDEEVVTNIELIEDDGNVGADEESSDQISWGCDAADKYAQGKISFNELNDVMEVRTRGRPRKKRKTDDEASKVDKDDENYQPEESPKKRRKARRKSSVLPKELEGLMGAANLAYAKGNTDDAIKMCMELIRLVPTANEPFHTLGLIYDEMGDRRKSFQCYLVGAYLNPSDTEEWIRLAELSIEQNEIQQAISCFSKAIKNEQTNINFLWERSNLYEQLGQRKSALTGYELIIKNLSSPEDGEKCVEMAREIAKVHHHNTDDANAVKVLETAFTKFPTLIGYEDVHFLSELQLGQKMYKSAVKTIASHCHIVLQTPNGEMESNEELNDFSEDDFKMIVDCTVPEELPIDLLAKFIVCLIQLKSLAAIQPLLNSIMAENPQDIGDLHLDVAEAFMEIKEFQSAKPLLLLLLSSPSYNLGKKISRVAFRLKTSCLQIEMPAVWMKYADCLHALNDVEEAIKAYQKVISLTPAYQEARLSLSKIYLNMGKKTEAMKILRQEYEEVGGGAVIVSKIGIEALYERCKLLESEENWEEFIKAGTLLQFSHCQICNTDEEFLATVSNQTAKRRNETLREIKTQTETKDPEFIGPNIPTEEMWRIFKKVCNFLMENKRYEELQALSLEALTSTMFVKTPEYLKDLEFQALLSCFYNGSHHYSYLLVRDLVLKNLNNTKAWNLFALMVIKSQENRHNRFCLRLMMKHQDHLALGFLNGHNAMVSGTYKHALGEYMCILKDHPNDIFTLFCVGITFIHMACQKFATKRHLLTIQGFAFLMKYLKLKGETQETLYNVGRALHQLGIKDAAVHYYKKALFVPPITIGSNKVTYDLRREIAYNLSLIYQATGAMDLVYLYTRKYIVV